MAVANGLEIKKTIKNKSFSFLLPLLKLRSYKNITNCYLGDINEDAFSNKLYILSEIDNIHLKTNPNYIKDYQVSDGIMYVLNMPKEYTYEYDQFLIGKYSKFRQSTKELLCIHACRNSSNKPHETQMYSILFKTEKRKKELEELLGVILDNDAEYASIFNDKLEIYGI